MRFRVTADLDCDFGWADGDPGRVSRDDCLVVDGWAIGRAFANSACDQCLKLGGRNTGYRASLLGTSINKG
jgi:hypothetical protein